MGYSRVHAEEMNTHGSEEHTENNVTIRAIDFHHLRWSLSVSESVLIVRPDEDNRELLKASH